MKYELRHVAYKPTKSASSIPATKMINDLEERATEYIGTFSEYNPIGFENDIAVIVRKEICTILPQKPFKLVGFELECGIRYHGENFNNNLGIMFSKQDLLRIANAMDDTDSLQILIPDSIDIEIFEQSIEQVVK